MKDQGRPYKNPAREWPGFFTLKLNDMLIKLLWRLF